MRLDPLVSRKKYDREIERLTAQQSVLQQHGVHLLAKSRFPNVHMVFVPRRPLHVAVPAAPEMAARLPPGAMPLMEVPGLSARAFEAKFDLADYDLQPPSVEFLDPWSGESLKFETMFRALGFDQNRKAYVVLLNDHPLTHRPFLCLRGVREYHEHPQHSGDDWLLYRATTGLFAIILAVWRAAIDLSQPQLVSHAGGVQVNWAAEEKV